MFFGSSRVSFIKNLVEFIGGSATDNNYIVTFIDEANSDYTDTTGTNIGSFWESDVGYFSSVMEDRNPNSYVVFNIETSDGSQGYIYPENSNSAPFPPFPEENIIDIFRPNTTPQQQQQFFETFLGNLEARWGTEIWNHLSNSEKKLLIVVDVSGSMSLQLIQESLDSFSAYLTNRSVEHYVLSGCANERWLAWGAAAYTDGENAGCSASCFWGKVCSYQCIDPTSLCYGNGEYICIAPYVFINGSVVPNECPPCNESISLCPDDGSGINQICLSCTSSEGLSCGECILPQYCSVCPIGGDPYYHKCVKCHYLSADGVTSNPPSFTYGISSCGIAHCSVTSETNFGVTSWNGSAWSWINETPGLSGPTLFGNVCYDNFKDVNDDCGVCPPETPDGDVLWKIEVCGEGCSSCGEISFMPVAQPSSINSEYYNVCLETVSGCTQ